MAAAAGECSSYTSEVSERRGIPAASFVQDVQSYLNQSGLDVNSALGFLQERSFLPNTTFFSLFFGIIIVVSGLALVNFSRYVSTPTSNMYHSERNHLKVFFFWFLLGFEPETSLGSLRLSNVETHITFIYEASCSLSCKVSVFREP